MVQGGSTIARELLTRRRLFVPHNADRSRTKAGQGVGCTSSPDGRSITIGPYEGLLAAARAQQRTDQFKAIYNGKRPTVERVIYRVVRNGGRKARYRGRIKVNEQLRLKAAAENLARMLRLGLVWTPGTGWAIARPSLLGAP